MSDTEHPQFTDPESQPSHPWLEHRFGHKTAHVISAVLEIVEIAVVSLALVVVIRTFLVQPFYVKGASMEPNYLDHEYLLIDEVSYRFHNPVRGDTVVFRYPRNPSEFFIKRVIGLPGETVTVSGGAISINGTRLIESYLDGLITGNDQQVTLPAGQYFLLGDNRTVSLDSRIFGPVSRSAIVGRVWLRGWPLDRAGVPPAPNYNF